MIISLLLLFALSLSSTDAIASRNHRLSVAQAQHRQRPLFVAASPSKNRQDNDNDDDWREQMLYILNDIRKKANKPAIERSPRADKMAQDHSNYQASINQMTHDDINGSLGQRATKAGILWSGVAENIAFGSQTVEKTMEMWTNSPLHYANMVGNYTQVGFGRMLNSTRSQNDVFWTQVFVYPWMF
ncbi:hypothetical protein J3B02_000189 [Coemansia erecta]|nr:hypothetical protein J3B02_000189 [Coemansia erecta]